jgi:hypothetical protein
MVLFDLDILAQQEGVDIDSIAESDDLIDKEEEHGLDNDSGTSDNARQ